MYMQPPKKLVDLTLYASLMRAGAESLAGADGAELFRDEFLMSLLRKNWPIPGDKHEPGYGAMNVFIMEKFSAYRPQDPRYTVDTDLGEWLQAAPQETREFLSDPQNLKELEEALDTARQAVTKAYGDPLNAPALGKSSLKQSFDAIKNSTTEAKTQRLDETIAFIRGDLLKYNTKGTPEKEFWARSVIIDEFWQRAEEKLAKQDWPFSQDPDATLLTALKLLTRGGSYAKLTKALEALDKQKDSPLPPGMADQLARAAAFILTNSKDLREAAETVFKELKAEARTSKGISLVRSALAQRISLN